MTKKRYTALTPLQTQKLSMSGHINKAGIETKQESKQSRNRNKAGNKIIYKKLDFIVNF